MMQSDASRTGTVDGPAGGATPQARTVEAWCEVDRTHALLASDRGAIESSRAVRALIVDLLDEDHAAERDLVNAFGTLGRVLADAHASPTLAASTVDGLAAATRGTALAPDEALQRTARATLFESYVLAVTTAHAEEARRGWEYPACVVVLGDGVAVAAGYPTDDAEALAAWASRVAQQVALRGARRVTASGTAPAMRALAEALDVAGVTLVEGKRA
jgi:hypothetical protein